VILYRQGVPVRVLIILVVLLGLTACSKKSAKVKLELTSSFVFGGSSDMQAVSEGGLMVWGISTNGESFGRVLNNADAAEVDIPNGNWTFSAVAWDNVTSIVMSGNTIRCARSEAMELKGEAASVSLVLSAAACNSDFYGNATAMQTDLNVRLCRDAGAVTALTDVCSDDKTEVGRVSDKAPFMSVRVSLEEFDRFGKAAIPQGAGLSRCVAMPESLNGEWSVPGNLNLPVGNPSAPETSPFRTSFELYFSSTDCGATGGSDSSRIVLNNGMASNQGNNKYFGASTEQYLYLHVPDAVVCSGRESLDPFAGGTGSDGRPYLICSAKQLYKIHNNGTSTYLSNSFRLMSDIDLNPYTKGLASVTDRPTQAASCWQIGQTWQPLGDTYSGCTRTPTGFSGSFYGGGHRITGMRMRLEDQSLVGFVGRWTPSVYKTITDLVFVDAEVSGHAGVGGVVGERTSGSITEISHINLIRPEIESRIDSGTADVGAVIGFGGSVNLTDIIVKDGRVEGQADFIGGVFGRLAASTKLNNIFATGLVSTRNSNSFVGGVGGRVESDSFGNTGFHSISHEGAIITNSLVVGGLFGKVDTINPFKDFYAVTAIKAFETNGSAVGGIIGDSDITGVLSRGYFAGHISNDCTTSCSRGLITGKNTSSLVGEADLYAINSEQPSPAGTGDDSGAITVGSVANSDTVGLFNIGGTPNLNSGVWQHVEDDLPRLTKQGHPCAVESGSLDFTAQVGLGRGTAANPILLCRKEQFAGLAALAANPAITRHVRIVGAVNLSGSFTSPDIPSNVVLTGKGALLFAYHRQASASGLQHWAPFNSNSGTMKDINLTNIFVRMVAADTPDSSVSGLVDTNSGVIEKVRLLASTIRQDTVANARANGLVRLNTASGRVSDFEVNARIVGDGKLNGAFYENYGIFEDGVVANQMNAATGVAIANVFGLGYYNYKTVRRIGVESRFEHTGYSVSSMSLGVRHNGPLGLLEDIEVTSEAHWSVGLFGLNVAQFVSINNGTVNRTLMNGQLYTNDSSVADVTVGYERSGQPIFQDNTTTSSGLVTAMPAGRVIAFATDTDFACAGNSAILDTGVTSGDFIEGAGVFWETTVNDPDDLVFDDKYVWIVAGGNGDDKEVSRVVGSYDTGTVITLTFDRPCAAAIPAGSAAVRIVQSFADSTVDMVGDLTATPFSGVIYAQELDEKSDLVTALASPWRNQILDESVGTDLTSIVNYYLAILKGEAPARPATWTFESGGDGLGLLNPNK